MNQRTLFHKTPKSLLVSLFTVLIVFPFASCEKKIEAPIELATVNTGEVTNITATEAEISNTVEFNGGGEVTARGVSWSTLPDPVITDNKTIDGDGEGRFESKLSGLLANTTYFARAYATNSRGTAYGDAKQFKTLDGIAQIVITNILDVEYTSATVNATVASDGGDPIIERGVCWSKEIDPTISDSRTKDGSGLGDYSASLSALDPNTTYNARAYATNSDTTYYSSNTTFKTKDDAPLPIANFNFQISGSSFLEVSFEDLSQNVISWTWNFGDGNASTEQNPVHIYNQVGTYVVDLTVTNSSGKTDEISKELVISDPDEALKLLTGDISKDWKLYREGVALEIGPSEEVPDAWFSLENNGQRSCSYDDTWTFHFDGAMEFDDSSSMWGEFRIWGSNPSENPLFETCFEPNAANMTIDGNDVSAWGSGTHSFDYDVEVGQLTLNGTGAWMVIPNLGTDASHDVDAFPLSKTVPISIQEFDGYDLLTVTFDYSDIFYRATYVSYNDWNDEPDLVATPPACVPEVAILPTEISHTFVSNNTDQWVLMQPIASGSSLELGVDDPAGGATKVGKYTRVAGVEWQELQFKLDPVNAINFENLTSITMDVYLPSSYNYLGELNNAVNIGFGATKCPQNWSDDFYEYQAPTLNQDQWVTLTFFLNDPDFVLNPANGATVYDRNDLDMIYINIGGNGHNIGAEFFIRNFKIQ